MQFPKLSDTQFPNLQTVNVYQFQNTFDYTRWNEKSEIKLCNVLWNSDYADVVKFDTDKARDEWFDNITDYHAINLLTAARIVPEGYVKLPIPYDVAARYNYLFVDMPIATSIDNPLDYETDNGIRRWYFFVHDIQYLSPNATQIYVIPDVWTNFQNKIDIPYMLLERGHAPVAASDVDSYLENPIANNKYLLAPDVNFDNAGITRSSSFVPFGNGLKYVCIASTCAIGQISSLGTVVADSGYSPTGNITYSNVDARYGYQLQVNGLSFGNGRDYSAARTPAKMGYSDGEIANNLSVYAINAYEVYGNGSTFFADIIEKCPQFLTTVKACFVVDENCLTFGEQCTIAGHTFHACVGRRQTLLTKALQKSDFSYPEELQRFAKLYTAPYAKLELTDNDGTTYEVNIEETSTLSVKSVVSVAFPYINERVYIEGIGGVGSKVYSWADLKNTIKPMDMPNSDWFKYCFDWEIPTFALYMDGETAFMLESFNRNVKQAKQQGLVNYHNSMRSANTAYENACDQADVAYNNTVDNALTGRDNSYRSADTGKTNADNIANMQHTNAYNSADAAKTNAENSADTAHSNTYDSANTAKTNADNSANTTYDNLDRDCTNATNNMVLANTHLTYIEEVAIDAADNIRTLNNNLIAANTSAANDICQYTTDANIEKSNATTMSSSVGGMASGALSGAASGAVIGASGGPYGAVAGGLIGLAGGAISAAVAQVNLGTTNNAAQSITDKQRDANSILSRETQDLNDDIQDHLDNVKYETYTDTISTNNDQLANSNYTARTNGTATKNTAMGNATNTQVTDKGNADRTKNTAYTNADNSYDATTTNADNLKDTSITNATNTKNTSRANASDVYDTTAANALRTKNNVQANALYTRQVAELNAKEILENGKYAAMAAVLDARNAPPVECCPYGGNPAPDYMQTRGVQIKVKTQSDSAIRQTGDTFARFGYALNQIWDVTRSGLKLMRHFTYWKAAEIWVDDAEASNNSVNTFIRNIFLNGVTVWNNPAEIGNINVYTN